MNLSILKQEQFELWIVKKLRAVPMLPWIGLVQGILGLDWEEYAFVPEVT